MNETGTAALFYRLGAWAAVITFVALPLFFIPVAWATIAHAKFILLALGVGIGVLALSLGGIMRGALSYPSTKTLAAAALIPIAYLVSSVMNGAVSNAFFGYGLERDTLLAAILWFGAFLLALFGFQERDRVGRAYSAFLVVAGLVFIFQFARLLIGIDILTLGGALVGPAASLVGSWHDLAIFFGFALLLGLSLSLASARTGFLHVASWTSVAFSLTALILVNVSDVWFVIGALSLCAGIYYFWSGKNTNSSSIVFPEQQGLVANFMRKEVFVWLLLAACGGVFGFWGSQVHSRLPERIRVVQVEVRPSWQGTFDVGTAVYKSGALFGSGPNTFTREWGKFKPQGVNETAFWNADFSQSVGFIPTTLITLGVLGIIAWILFFAVFLWEGFRVIRKSLFDARIEPMVVGVFAGALFLWAMLVIYPPGPVVIALAFLATGLFFSFASHTGLVPLRTIDLGASSGLTGLVKKVIVAFIGFGVLLSAGLLARSVLSDLLVNRAVSGFNATGDIAQAQALVSRALMIQKDNDRADRAGVELGLLQLGILAQSTSSDAAQLQKNLQSTIASAIDHGISATAKNPEGYQNWILLARAYEQLVGARVEGAYERAEEAYNEAIKVNPSNPGPYLFLARLAAARGDAAKANQYLVEAVKRKSNFAEAYFLGSQIAVAQNNLTEARQLAELAVRSSPQEPVAWFQLGAIVFAQGDYQNAAIAFEQAVIRNNNYANALYLLALSAAQIGNLDVAEQALQRVLLLNPGNQEITNLLKGVEQAKAKAAAAQPVSTSTANIKTSTTTKKK